MSKYSYYVVKSNALNIDSVTELNYSEFIIIQ